MDKAATQPDITGKKNPVRRKCTSAIAAALQCLSECGETIPILLAPTQPRLNILQAVLAGITSGQQRRVSRQRPGAESNGVLNQHTVLRQLIALRPRRLAISVGA